MTRRTSNGGVHRAQSLSMVNRVGVGIARIRRGCRIVVKLFRLRERVGKCDTNGEVNDDGQNISRRGLGSLTAREGLKLLGQLRFSSSWRLSSVVRRKSDRGEIPVRRGDRS